MIEPLVVGRLCLAGFQQVTAVTTVLRVLAIILVIVIIIQHYHQNNDYKLDRNHLANYIINHLKSCVLLWYCEGGSGDGGDEIGGQFCFTQFQPLSVTGFLDYG